MSDYEKFKAIYNEIDLLISNSVRCSDPRFKEWEFRADRFLAKHYGQESEERIRFSKVDFGEYHGQNDILAGIRYKSGLQEAKAIFKVYLDELEQEDFDRAAERIKAVGGEVVKINNWVEKKYDKVFIVHGHDEALKQEVARIVEKQGLEAIILSKQAKQGKTIIEKIEENADVDAAICLFTGDDYGRAKGTEAEENKLRARQNVVFEAGYFMGKLGRGNVILIASPDIEIPSDLQGVVYTNKDMWQMDVLRELKAIGYNVDFNKLFARKMGGGNLIK